MKRLNLNELFVGACVGLYTSLFIGWWAIPVAVCSALLWAIGGAYGHSWRVYGVPMVLSFPVGLRYHSPIALLPGLLMMAVLSMGYGIPTVAPGRADNDEGSALGRFWYTITGGNLFWANFLTRGTIYALLVLCTVPWWILRLIK